MTVGSPVADALVVDGARWRRTVLHTPWLTERHDLGAVLAEAMTAAPASVLATSDGRRVLAVAEKAAVVTSGRAVAVDPSRCGRLARVLARAVRPVGDSRGLSVPAKMQYVLDEVGHARVLCAAAAAAVTRPLGLPGVFYRVAGTLARDLDGVRGAYPRTLLPPLAPGEAQLLAYHLSVRLGIAVAIVDVNDRGGSVRGRSPGCPPADVLLAVLAGNPHGDGGRSTPAVLLHAVPRVTG